MARPRRRAWHCLYPVAARKRRTHHRQPDAGSSNQKPSDWISVTMPQLNRSAEMKGHLIGRKLQRVTINGTAMAPAYITIVLQAQRGEVFR
jgi:hypothetical protein